MGSASYEERAMRFDKALAEAKTSGSADETLAGMLADRRHDSREMPLIASALASTRGHAGSSALRSAAAEAMALLQAGSPRAKRESSDVAWACVWALGERDGAAATDVFLDAVHHPDRDLSGLGMELLAAVGDDRAWDDMITRLAKTAQASAGSSKRRQVEMRHAIEYLARHAAPGSERAIRLITLIRERWKNIASHELLEQWWPGIGPDGIPPETINLSAHVPLAPWQP